MTFSRTPIPPPPVTPKRPTEFIIATSTRSDDFDNTCNNLSSEGWEEDTDPKWTGEFWWQRWTRKKPMSEEELEKLAADLLKSGRNQNDQWVESFPPIDTDPEEYGRTGKTFLWVLAVVVSFIIGAVAAYQYARWECGQVVDILLGD